ASGAVTINLADSSVPSNTSVTGYGGTVTLTGVEVLNATAGGNIITVTGTAGPDNLSVTPTGTNTATITNAGLNLTLNTANTAALRITPAADNDVVTVNGTSAADAISVVRG